MSITLNHTIVPARDKVASARFFAELFGLGYDGPMGPFAPVRVNPDFTMDFDDREIWAKFEPHHYAFRVSDDEFDAIFGRIQEKGLIYGSGPFSSKDMKVGQSQGGRVVYFRDLAGHLLEIRTAG